MKISIHEILSKNEFFSLLTGKGEYEMVCVLADMPTDPQKVMSYIKADIMKDNNVKMSFFNSLIELSNSPTYSWLVLYYLVGILRIEAREKVHLDSGSLIPEISKALLLHKEKLEKNHCWVGKIWSNGLWGDVERMSKNIFEEFGLKIYPYKG